MTISARPADDPEESCDLKTELINAYRKNLQINKKPEIAVIFTESVIQNLLDSRPSGLILKSTNSSNYLFRLYNDLLIPKEYLCGKEYRNIEKVIGNKRYNLVFHLEPEHVTSDMVLYKVVPARVKTSTSQNCEDAYYEIAEMGKFCFQRNR